MGYSIQDYVKKINSRITVLDCVSLLVTTLFLLAFLLFLYKEKTTTNIPVSYIASQVLENKSLSSENSRPFASRQGKTYTFSWCQGATMISAKNKIYYKNEDEAKRSGKVLSKLCEK